MIVGRILGWIFIFLSVVVAGWDAMSMIDRGQFDLIKLGEFWFKFSPGTLNGLQAGVERYISPLLWDWVLAPLLHWPLLVVVLTPGVLLVVLCRWRRPGKKSRLFPRRGR